MKKIDLQRRIKSIFKKSVGTTYDPTALISGVEAE